MKLHTTITITREYEDPETGNIRGEAEIEVEASYTPGVRATHLDPEEYPEVEIISVTIDGYEDELTEAEEDAVKQEILNNPPEREYD